MDAATESKAAVEDAQREDVKKREENSTPYVPRFFELRDGLWHAKLQYVFFWFLLFVSWLYTRTWQLAFRCHSRLSGILTHVRLFTPNRLPSGTDEQIAAVQEWIWPTGTARP